jgi:hypothetical protein
MNLPMIALLVLALAQSDTKALVDAAKEAKAKRKAGGARKVITNADLARSKGKVIQRKPEDLAPLPPLESIIEKQEAEKKAKAQFDEQVTAMDAVIATLEKEVAVLEQSYYEASDLDHRDKVIVARFTETKAKLDEARANREALVPPDSGKTSSSVGPVVEVIEPGRPEQPPLH